MHLTDMQLVESNLYSPHEAKLWGVNNINKENLQRCVSLEQIFNLFHAVTHFATHFNLMTPFQKFAVRLTSNAIVFAQ